MELILGFFKMAATNIRELTFEHVLETILKPAGVKVGGFPEEIFLDLTDKEKEDWLCSIWYVPCKFNSDSSLLNAH